MNKNKKKQFYAIIIFQYGETEIIYEEVTSIIYTKTIEEARIKVEKFVQKEIKKSGLKGYKLVEVEVIDDVLFEKKNDLWHINSRFFLDWKAYRKFREMIDRVENRND